MEHQAGSARFARTDPRRLATGPGLEEELRQLMADGNADTVERLLRALGDDDVSKNMLAFCRSWPTARALAPGERRAELLNEFTARGRFPVFRGQVGLQLDVAKGDQLFDLGLKKLATKLPHMTNLSRADGGGTAPNDAPAPALTATQPTGSPQALMANITSDVSGAAPGSMVTLIRGCTPDQLARFAGTEVDIDAESPDEDQARRHVGEDSTDHLIEFTNNGTVGTSFATGNYIVKVQIARRYLTEGSTAEAGWVCLPDAPFRVIAIYAGQDYHPGTGGDSMGQVSADRIHRLHLAVNSRF